MNTKNIVPMMPDIRIMNGLIMFQGFDYTIPSLGWVKSVVVEVDDVCSGHIIVNEKQINLDYDPIWLEWSKFVSVMNHDSWYPMDVEFGFTKNGSFVEIIE